MSGFSIKFEWESPGAAAGDQLRATWARYEIHAGDNVITRLVDPRSRSQRDGLYGPLLPIAELIAENWFHIFFEVGSKFTRTDAYRTRHNLLGAGDGYAYPSLSLLPSGSHVEIVWHRRVSENPRLEFISQGHTRIGRAELERTLANFIEAVCLRLEEQGCENTYLHQEWSNITALDKEEVEFAEAIASLGIDPFDVNDVTAKDVLDAYESLPRTLIPELFAVSTLGELSDQVKWIKDALDKLHSCDDNLYLLPSLSADFRKAFSRFWFMEPHEKGLRAAKFVRSQLNLHWAPLGDIDNLLVTLGSKPGLGKACLWTRQEHRKVHAVTLGGAKPRLLVARRRQDSTRFAICRSVYNVLSKEGEVNLVTDSYLEEDRASRAFAAEFLAPAEGLKERVNTNVLVEEDVLKLANEYGVSIWVIEHQIENNNIAQIVYESRYPWR